MKFARSLTTRLKGIGRRRLVIALIIVGVGGALIGLRPPKAKLLHTLNEPTAEHYGLFGESVAISENRVVVGAFNSTGGAYLFDATTGSLISELVNPAPAPEDYFGRSVAIHGKHVLVGAPGNRAAYLYNASTGALLRTISITANFGAVVALSDDYIVGRSFMAGNGFTGNVRVFDLATGSQLRTLNGPTAWVGDSFGDAIAIAGRNILVGDPAADTGGESAGSAYIFDAATGELLRTFHNPIPSTSRYFGSSVAIWGKYAIVGDLGGLDGCGTNGYSGKSNAHVFNAWSGSLVRSFKGTSGSNVAISGRYVLVGAPWEDTGMQDSGNAYLFSAATGRLLRKIRNPTPGPHERFGGSVAISGKTILIGAPRDNWTTGRAGTAYLFSAPELGLR